MAVAKKGTLIALINSLDSAEKRFFTSNYQRREGGTDEKFYRLFTHLSAGGDPQDPDFQRSLGITKGSQLANLQRHLYGLLLESLRRQHRNKVAVVAVREYIDYAQLLYQRGLYLQALRILQQAKKEARALHLDLHHLLIVEFEKMIESRHITRADTQRMEDLMAESRHRQYVYGASINWSNLQLALQRHFINHGHVADAAAARIFYQRHAHHFRESLNEKDHTFRERVGAHRSRFWYHYVMLQLPEAARSARAWVAEFANDPAVRSRDVNLYLKGLDRCLLIAFFRDEAEEHRLLAGELRNALGELPANQQSRATRQLGELLQDRARLNQLILDERTDLPRALARELAAGIDKLRGVDRHKQHVLRYKLAVLCTRAGRPQDALDHLRPILEDRRPLREDLVVYSRLLHICCQHRTGLEDVPDYGINNLARYLGRIDYPSPYPRLALRLLRALRRNGNAEAAFADFAAGVETLRRDVFNLRELRYLDLPAVLTPG